MDKSIFEVTRDEYVGFIREINPNSRIMEKEEDERAVRLKVVSNKTGKVLCERIIPEEGDEIYYVYEMPDPNERIAPKPVQKIVLETPEEVQAFMDILSKLQKGENLDD